MQDCPGNTRIASSITRRPWPCARGAVALVGLVVGLGVAPGVGPGRPAYAQSIGLELDLGIPVGDTSDVLDLGWGVGGRLGYGLPVPQVTFDLEAIFQYYSFPIEDLQESAGLWRVGGGLRFGFGIPVFPEIFGHLGYGSMSIDTGLGEATQDGLTWDLGISSNVVELPVLALGVHLAYVKLVPDDPTTFLAFGIHGELGF